MCIHTKHRLPETFICVISMIRGDAGQGNEAGEVLKREILTAPAPCLRLAHRCRATFCAAGQTGPAGRVSTSCMYAQACVPVQSSYPHQLCMKYTLQHHSVIHAYIIIQSGLPRLNINKKLELSIEESKSSGCCCKKRGVFV